MESVNFSFIGHCSGDISCNKCHPSETNEEFPHSIQQKQLKYLVIERELLVNYFEIHKNSAGSNKRNKNHEQTICIGIQAL